MKKVAIILAGCILLLISGCIEGMLDTGWADLTKGSWVQRGDMKALFEISDGVLIGSTNKNRGNSFYCTQRSYSDFILDLDFKVGDPILNSGIQIRSHSLESYKNGRVHGYQVEIDASLNKTSGKNLNADGTAADGEPRSWTAGIYDEARRGWINDLSKNPAARKAYKRDQWNHLRIEAVGNSINTWINGVPAADLKDDMDAEGFIGFQVHGTSSDKKMQVMWKNIRIKEIK